jgi:hypothetical protein
MGAEIQRSIPCSSSNPPAAVDEVDSLLPRRRTGAPKPASFLKKQTKQKSHWGDIKQWVGGRGEHSSSIVQARRQQRVIRRRNLKVGGKG